MNSKYYNDETALNQAIIKVVGEKVFLPQVYTYRYNTGELFLFIATWIPDYYNRSHFSQFISCWEDELDVIIRDLIGFLDFN